MSETIEVYFKNENDAESAQAQLRTLEVKHMYVEEMPEDTDTALFVHFFPTNIDSTTAGSTGVVPASPIISGEREELAGPNYPSYLLYVEVETEDYDEAMAILQEHECFTREEK